MLTINENDFICLLSIALQKKKICLAGLNNIILILDFQCTFWLFWTLQRIAEKNLTKDTLNATDRCSNLLPLVKHVTMVLG